MGSVIWVALLLPDGIITVVDIPGAALFGLVNTAVGIGIHQGVLWLVRRVRSVTPSRRSSL